MKKLFIISGALLIAAAIFLFFLLKQPSFHFQRALGFQILKNGNILVTDGGGYDWTNTGSKVFIINRKGRVLWEYNKGVNFAHSAVKLKNNNILIPDTNNDRIVEVSPDKKIVWESRQWGNGTGKLSDGTIIDYPNYIEEAENGRFLLSARYSGAVFETNRKGKVFWSYKKLKKQHAPRRLKNGNTLIADSHGNRIIEVNRDGEIVWQYSKGLRWPRYADRLKNGNTLITDSNNDRILEITPGGEVVFEYGKGILAKPYQANELENGNIMISDAQHARLLEINRNKKIVWKYSSKNPEAVWLKMPFEMKNAGAEKLDENMMPLNWRVCDMIAPDAGIWSVDEKVSCEGENSFKISGKGNYGINKFWGQYIKNIGGKKIKVSFMIKTKDVKQGAGVSINFVDFKGGIIGGVNSKAFKGDNNWTEILILTQVPDKTAVIGVTLSLVGPGTAWWDAGKMEKL